MATPADGTVPFTGNPQIDALTQGSSWQFGAGPRILTYSFSLNDNPIGGPWTSAFANPLRQVLAEWSNVANLSFVDSGSGTIFTNSPASLAITLTGNQLQAGGFVGLGFFPSPAVANSVLQAVGYSRAAYPQPEGDVFFDNYYSGYAYLSPGGIGFKLMLHEIGHALGLKHPFDNGGGSHPTFTQAGIGSLNTTHYTVMSDTYPNGLNFSQFNSATPMLLDIQAIQAIYGANMAYHTGDDTYVLSASAPAAARTIWDAAGIDTIDASTIGQGITIDLHAGSFINHGISGNVTAIAYRVTIENAIGTALADTFIGNDAANVLDGRGGADSMSGGAGNDTYVVDNAGDMVNEGAAQGIDTVLSSVSYILGSNVENLTLTGSASTNGTGNALDNVLTGNSGNNILAGGTGNDTYIVQNVSDQAVENPGEGSDTIVTPFSFNVSGTNAENVTLSGIANVNATGDAGANILMGNGGANVLNGAGGNDLLSGGAGVDTLDGGAGIDAALYMGARSTYAVLQAPNGALAVSGRIDGMDGLDLVFGIESIQFGDRTVSPAAAGNDVLSYIASYADLCRAFGIDTQAAFDHYVSNGYFEGRFPTFNGLEYIASFRDLISAFGANKDAGSSHYITNGSLEGRVATFSGLEYIASHGDLIAAFGASKDSGASHYISNGYLENRVTNAFDGLEYIASHGDLINAFGANRDAGTTHYITSGFSEHRTTHSFDPAAYLARYPDLRAALGDNYDAATLHYVSWGYFEGRSDHPLL